MREDIRRELLTRELIQRQVANRITISEREVERFLAQQGEAGDARYRLGHILVALPRSPSSQQVQEAALSDHPGVTRLILDLFRVKFDPAIAVDVKARKAQADGGAGAADVAKIKAPLMIHYAALDDRINAGWPAYETALKANHVKYEMHMYAGTNHGFHNDTTPRYDKDAATLAWDRTIAWFNKYVK